MEENWRPVIGFEDRYAVSDLGGLKSIPRIAKGPHGSTRRMREKPLKQRVNHQGYLVTMFYSPEKGHVNMTTHLAVLRSFIGLAPPGLEARHLNGVRSDARLGNLVWGTKAENEADKTIHGTRVFGELARCAKLTTETVSWIIESGQTIAQMAHSLGVSPRTVGLAKCGKTWRHVKLREYLPFDKGH